MAPKEPFKVHSLSKHIENTNKGLSADAQYNRRPLSRPAPVVKKEPEAVNKSIFGNDEDNDDDSSGSESSGDEGGAEFLRKLSQPAAKPAAASNASKCPGKDVEIADSDAERNDKARAIKPESDSSGDSSSDSDSDESQKPKANANGAAIKKASSSSDPTSDSDSDDEKQPAAVKKSESTSDSETSDSDSEESESDSEADKTKPATKPAVNGNAAKSASSSEDSSSEESDSGDAKIGKPASKQSGPSYSSAASPAESDPVMVDESIHMEDRQPEGQIVPPSAIAPDFVLRKSDEGTSGEDVARICCQANMQGKQFWYFTVPSGVPISVVQNLEIPMDASQRGGRAFTHGGENFGISFDSMVPKSYIQIMIPSTDGTQYQAASQQIDRVMQVRRITQLGANGSTVGPSEKNGPRPQPKGLKARFKPIGVDSPMGKIGMDSSSDGEDCEMADAPTLPSALEAQPVNSTPKGKKGKRKEAAVEASQKATGPRSGKRKQPSSEDEAAAAASQLMEESHTAETKTKKPKTDRAGSPDLGSEPPLPATAGAKQTPVMLPTIPALVHSLSGLGSTPAAASSPLTGKAKKSKNAKSEQPVPSSSHSLSAAKKDAPVPIPRQTAVPIPPIPGSSQQPKVSPVPIPLPAATTSVVKDVKKGKKSKGSAGNAAGIASSQQTTPPTSAQAPEKRKKKQTAIQAPESKAPA